MWGARLTERRRKWTSPRGPPSPPMTGPRPGGLSLLAPAERGLCLAIMQAERGQAVKTGVVRRTKFSTDQDRQRSSKSSFTIIKMGRAWDENIRSMKIEITNRSCGSMLSKLPFVSYAVP